MMGNQKTIVIDLSLYSLTAVKKVCYKFTSICIIKFKDIENNKIEVCLQFKTIKDEGIIDNTIDRFYNELLDQDLREAVYKETEAVRNIILAHAFSNTPFIEN